MLKNIKRHNLGREKASNDEFVEGVYEVKKIIKKAVKYASNEINHSLGRIV